MQNTLSEDMQKFLKTYQAAKDGKDAKAMYELANYYADKSDENLREKAFSLYRKSAKFGCTEGMFGMGICYEFGIGTPKDYKKAISWYSAAERHITEDLMNNPDPVGEKERELVRTYLDNEDIINAFFDSLEAQREEIDILENDINLAENEDAEAQFRMGCRYLDGNGVEKD